MKTLLYFSLALFALFVTPGCQKKGPASCTDGILNQGEIRTDCGGPCVACASCYDGVKNQDETAIDCGGSCPKCPTCSDGIKNQNETNIDCGGPCLACGSCTDGIQSPGETGIDCGGPCNPCGGTCTDGIQNQGEKGIDCGGPCAACPTCTDGIQNQGETQVDCGGPCSACATCTDGIQNQGETGVDCGGPCQPCLSGIKYPSYGNFGPNILKDSIVTITGGVHYDMKANIKSGSSVKVVIKNTPQSGAIWYLSTLAIDGWAITGYDINTKSQTFYADGPVITSLEMWFTSSGSAYVDIYENGATTPTSSKIIWW